MGFQGGSPTLSIALFMYEQGFRWWNMGYAAAIAFVLFLVVLGGYVGFAIAHLGITPTDQAYIDRLVHHSTIFELHQVESYRGKEAARQQKLQRENDKAQRKRQSSGDNDNQPEEPHP